MVISDAIVALDTFVALETKSVLEKGVNDDKDVVTVTELAAGAVVETIRYVVICHNTGVIYPPTSK